MEYDRLLSYYLCANRFQRVEGVIDTLVHHTRGIDHDRPHSGPVPILKGVQR